MALDTAILANDVLLPQPRGLTGEADLWAKQFIATLKEQQYGLVTATRTLTQTLEDDYLAADSALFASITVELGVLTTDVSALASRVTTVEAQINTPTTGILARVTTTETSIATLDGAVATLETTVSSHTTSISTLISDLNAAEATIVTNTANIATNASAITTLNSSVATLNTTVSAHTSSIATLQTDLDTAEATIVTNTANISTNASAITSLTSSVSTLSTTVSSNTTSINTINSTKNQTFRQTSAPSALAIGDLWVDTDDNNKLYRASATGTGSWVAVDDARIAAVLADVAAAEATIITNTADISTNASAITTLNSSVATLSTTVSSHTTSISGLTTDVGLKARTFRQTSAPTATATGDLWIDSDDGEKLYRWSGSVWVAVDDARIATTAATVATHATAITTNTSAIATLTTSLAVQVSANPNMLPNGGFAQGSTSWTLAAGASVTAGKWGQILNHPANTSTHNTWSDPFPISSSSVYTLSGDMVCFGGGGSIVRLELATFTSLANANAYASPTYLMSVDATVGQDFGGTRKSVSGTTGGTATYARILLTTVLTATATAAQFRRIKFEPGSVATAFSDEQTDVELSASVVVNAAVIAALDSRVSAFYGISVNAGTGVASLELLASGGGSPSGQVILTATDFIINAETINFGADTVYEDTYNTFYTTSGGYRYRDRGPFGASSDLLHWFGPTSVALNSETKTNGVWALGTDGKVYYGTAELNGNPPAQLSLEPVGLVQDIQTYPTNASVFFTLLATGGVAPYIYGATKLAEDGDTFTSASLSGDDFSATLNSASGVSKTGTQTWLFTVTDDEGTVVTTVGQIGLATLP